MASHSSATVLEKPHVNQTARTATPRHALKRRAQVLLNDSSIDPQSRSVIRYALETDDPLLARLLRHAWAGESVETFDFSQTPEHDEDDPSEQKIEALAEMICHGGDKSAAALLVLMAMLENAKHPRALLNQAKHFAFACCGDLNLYGIVDREVAALESELLSGDLN